MEVRMTVRPLKTLTLLGLTGTLAACGGPAGDGTTDDRPASPPSATTAATTTGGGPFLYVTNERGGTGTVIDVATLEPVATVALGKRPRGIALSPDRAHAYVALSGSPIAGPGVDEKT